MNTPENPSSDIALDGVGAVMSAVGATLLIVTELLGSVFAFAWAIGGLLGLGDNLTYALMALVGLPGLYYSLALTRRVLTVEKRLADSQR
jgi:hypothetical protein